MTPECSSIAGINVSRETLERLELFETVLRKWNPKINLVSKGSLQDLWTRHIVDSVQVFGCAQPKGHWVDIGSGGGFPGIVVAILSKELAPELKVTLIESDQRKCAFLRAAARETEASCTVVSQRIEAVEAMEANILSARALADLTTLLGFAKLHLAKGGVALFPKGITWEKELQHAQREWKFDATPVTSLTESSAVILKIKGVERG